MRKMLAVYVCLLILPCFAVAAEYPRIPFADSGSQMLADVDAVLKDFVLTDEQQQQVERAKEEFKRMREKTLADYVAKFTEVVGNPDEVFAKLDDEKTSADEKAQLQAKIDRFAAEHSSRVRTQMAMLEGNLRRDVGKGLGDNDAQFRVELSRRLALKATKLGAYYLKASDGPARLTLNEEQKKNLVALLDLLKSKYDQAMKDYTNSFTARMGDPKQMASIRRKGTPEERAAIDKKIADARAELQAELEKKTEGIISSFEKEAKKILTAEQWEALAKLVK